MRQSISIVSREILVARDTLHSSRIDELVGSLTRRGPAGHRANRARRVPYRAVRHFRRQLVARFFSLSFLHVHTHAQLTRALARLRVLFSPSCRLLAVLDQPRSSLSGALLVLLVLQYLVRLRERL